MSNINEGYIEDYIREVIPERNTLFKEMEDYALENHVPIIHPEVAQFIRVMVKIKRAKKVLEIGTAIGYSALVISEAMNQEGRITTIERREDMIHLAKGNFQKAGVLDRITVLRGEAETVLPDIEEDFDFIFLDAAKGKYMEFLPYCIKNLVKGGIIVSDNVLFKGMVANDDLVVRRKKTIVRRMRDYLDYICHHQELETSVIPIGDGIALTYKKEEKNE